MDIGNILVDWKSKQVTFIHKGSQTEVSNYHPVSLTSVLCKVIGKLVRNVMLDQMFHKKLRYLRGSARHALLVEMLSTAAQLCEQSHLEKLAVGKQP